MYCLAYVLLFCGLVYTASCTREFDCAMQYSILRQKHHAAAIDATAAKSNTPSSAEIRHPAAAPELANVT